ncbi:hypothetical protein VMF7928_02927 [Vibrio marisflavi CECT 7928]|uniref:Uncharacterized protein n=1 Tax=Vibrio marisflavi CECT 7928 TaxID=634439 RepID=A0ABM9A647_9VIBR|nr:hypothetical protein VMF7928_02927 [Vibrio marisflavi CECT 7928]
MLALKSAINAQDNRLLSWFCLIIKYSRLGSDFAQYVKAQS